MRGSALKYLSNEARQAPESAPVRKGFGRRNGAYRGTQPWALDLSVQPVTLSASVALLAYMTALDLPVRPWLSHPCWRHSVQLLGLI